MTRQGKQETLEAQVLALLAGPLRQTAARRATRKKTGARDEAIERAIASPAVRHAFDAAVTAFLLEQILPRLRRFLRALDDSDAWAWKIVLDAFDLARHLQNVPAGTPEEPPDTLISSEFEHGVLNNIRELLRGPNADDQAPQEVADIARAV